MQLLWKTTKYTMSLLLVIGLVFSSGVFSVILYAKLTGREWGLSSSAGFVAYADKGTPAPAATLPPPPPKKSALLQAPALRQYPELPSGCEVTSLTMLLQYAGISVHKTDLVPVMKKDPSELKRGPDGTIISWGNPNLGFVGDVTGKSKGFGIYHSPLLDLLNHYFPSGVDLSNRPFEELEKQVSEGFPVVVWTTIDFAAPDRWVVWDTSIGPFQTTFAEHAVLLVGYDENSVYVNDPATGKAGTAIDKARFVQTWQAMGQQAISYRTASK